MNVLLLKHVVICYTIGKKMVVLYSCQVTPTEKNVEFFEAIQFHIMTTTTTTTA